MMLKNPIPLPFVDGDNYWAPDRTGTFAAQNARGREYARLLNEAMFQTRDPNMLIRVVRHMDRSFMTHGVEIGFFTMIAQYAIYARQEPE